MKYVLTGLAGIGTAATVSILYLLCYVCIYVFQARRKFPVGPVGIDFRSFFGTPSFWLVIVLAFLAGFYWRLRTFAS